MAPVYGLNCDFFSQPFNRSSLRLEGLGFCEGNRGECAVRVFADGAADAFIIAEIDADCCHIRVRFVLLCRLAMTEIATSSELVKRKNEKTAFIPQTGRHRVSGRNGKTGHVAPSSRWRIALRRAAF